MKYEYFEDDECFRRVDNRGRPLFVNISEALQIESLMNLGYSVEEIKDRVKLSNRKAGRNTVVSMIKNIREGNVDLTGDYTIPVNQLVEVDDDMRISALEKRVDVLETALARLKPEYFIDTIAGKNAEIESRITKVKRKLGL